MKGLIAGSLGLFFILNGSSVLAKNLVLEKAGNWMTVFDSANIISVVNLDKKEFEIFIMAIPNVHTLAMVVRPVYPIQTIQEMNIDFDNKISLKLQQTMLEGSLVYASHIPAMNTPIFVHNFTAAKKINIHYGTQVASQSLSGSTNALEAISILTKEHAISLPAPFTPAEVLDPSTANQTSNNTLPESPISSQQSTPTTQISTTNLVSNNQEQQFIEMVNKHISMFESGTNEMAKGAARPARAQATCSMFPSKQISGWIGTVVTLSSTNSGKGILIVNISPNIQLSTSNGDSIEALSKLVGGGEPTLLEPGTAVFNVASQLKEGQKIKFSGNFLPSKKDCFLEMSVTQEGSLRSPEYAFHFTDITPL